MFLWVSLMAYTANKHEAYQTVCIWNRVQQVAHRALQIKTYNKENKNFAWLWEPFTRFSASNRKPTHFGDFQWMEMVSITHAGLFYVRYHTICSLFYFTFFSSFFFLLWPIYLPFKHFFFILSCCCCFSIKILDGSRFHWIWIDFCLITIPKPFRKLMNTRMRTTRLIS